MTTSVQVTPNPARHSTRIKRGRVDGDGERCAPAVLGSLREEASDLGGDGVEVAVVCPAMDEADRPVRVDDDDLLSPAVRRECVPDSAIHVAGDGKRRA